MSHRLKKALMYLLILILIIIFMVFVRRNKINESLDYRNKELNILLKIKPPNHPDIATSHNNIDLIYFNKGEKDQALEFLLKSLEIRILT